MYRLSDSIVKTHLTRPLLQNVKRVRTRCASARGNIQRLKSTYNVKECVQSSWVVISGELVSESVV